MPLPEDIHDECVVLLNILPDVAIDSYDFIHTYMLACWHAHTHTHTHTHTEWCIRKSIFLHKLH